MSCKKCGSKRIVDMSAKCSDCCWVNMVGGRGEDGYVPSGMGIGGGDYVEMRWCLDCGQIQGEFPLEKCELEQDDSEEE
jgi:hypothetical protein